MNAPLSSSSNPTYGYFFMPSVRLNREMRILYANPAAESMGITPDDVLVPRPTESELLRHEACFSRSLQTRYDPLSSPQNSALYEIESYRGFRFIYVEYTYTFHECQAVAVLFGSRKEYLSFTSFLSSGPHRYCTILKDEIRMLRKSCRALLDNTLAQDATAGETVENLMSATLLTLKCFYPDSQDSADIRTLSLRRLIKTYISSVLQHAYFVDCAVSLENARPNEDPDLYVELDMDNFYILLTAMLSALSDLSDDRRIRISLEGCGIRRCIRFTTQCRQMTNFLYRTSDIQVLAAAAPKKQMQITLTEYIAAYSGFDIDVFEDVENGLLHVAFTLPAQSAENDFKSPAETDRHLMEASRAACGLIALFNAEQKQENHNDIH